MCGIAGFSLSPTEHLDALGLSRSLLLAIERRGPHATGAVWTEADGGNYYDKAALPARRYVDRLPLSPTSTTAAIHTRFATKGDPANNGNNHPFVLPGITGVHNGVLRNDDAIFARLGVEREAPGQTDSEAIFALLAYGDYDHPTEALAEVEGDAAVAWIETERPRSLHLARLSGRPLAVGTTPAGSLLFASTLPLLREAAGRARVRLDRSWDVPEWTYLRVWRGGIQEVRRFAPNRVGTVLWTPSRDGWPTDDDGRDARDLVPAALRLGR